MDKQEIIWKSTDSDVGGLKIGNESFSIIVPNGIGDGTMHYAIVDAKPGEAHKPFRYFTSIEGNEINIYSYDCGNAVAETVSGSFAVYYHEGRVLIEKWK